MPRRGGYHLPLALPQTLPPRTWRSNSSIDLLELAKALPTGLANLASRGRYRTAPHLNLLMELADLQRRIRFLEIEALSSVDVAVRRSRDVDGLRVGGDLPSTRPRTSCVRRRTSPRGLPSSAGRGGMTMRTAATLKPFTGMGGPS